MQQLFDWNVWVLKEILLTTITWGHIKVKPALSLLLLVKASRGVGDKLTTKPIAALFTNTDVSSAPKLKWATIGTTGFGKGVISACRVLFAF